MIQEKHSDDLNSIPLISDIPYLGRLFGNTNASTSRTEMLVLVTGYIVDEKGKVEDMIKRYNDAVKALSKFEGEIARNHIEDLKREERIRQEKLEKLKKLQEAADTNGAVPEESADSTAENTSAGQAGKTGKEEKK